MLSSGDRDLPWSCRRASLRGDPTEIRSSANPAAYEAEPPSGILHDPDDVCAGQRACAECRDAASQRHNSKLWRRRSDGFMEACDGPDGFNPQDCEYNGPSIIGIERPTGPRVSRSYPCVVHPRSGHDPIPSSERMRTNTSPRIPH
jgi:hypothetical protein